MPFPTNVLPPVSCGQKKVDSTTAMGDHIGRHDPAMHGDGVLQVVQLGVAYVGGFETSDTGHGAKGLATGVVVLSGAAGTTSPSASTLVRADGVDCEVSPYRAALDPLNIDIDDQPNDEGFCDRARAGTMPTNTNDARTTITPVPRHTSLRLTDKCSPQWSSLPLAPGPLVCNDDALAQRERCQ